MSWTQTALGLSLPLALMACGPVPTHPVERALYRDLDQVVQSRERTRWLVDRQELETALPNTLVSLCATPEPHRAGLDRWLTARLEAEGGDPKAAWIARGKDKEAIEDLLHLSRVQRVLRHGMAHAEADCPFWIETSPEFSGVETQADRFVLYLEGQGGLMLAQKGDDTLAVGGGGGGRLLAGYGVGEQLAISAGIEVGGISELPRDADGTRSVRAHLDSALPLMLSVTDGLFRWDSEVALLRRAREDSLDDPRYGTRVSQSLGLTTLSVGPFKPYAGLWFAWEWLPKHGAEPSHQGFRAGTRVGVIWGF